MLSAMSGHENATKWLLENKADVNAVIETNKNSALSLATAHGRSASVVQLLVDHSAALEHRTKARNGIGFYIRKCCTRPSCCCL